MGDNLKACRYCANLDKGVCKGGYSKLGYNEEDTRERTQEILCKWLSWDFAEEVATEALERIEKSIGVVIAKPDEFYCSEWR